MALYGSTTVSDTCAREALESMPLATFDGYSSRCTVLSATFGDGITEYVVIIRSGYSSRILDMSRVPMPDPVPPPRECVS